jgi:hypothetical protein
MNNLDSMLERNKDFAAQQSAAGTLMPSLPQAFPNVRAIVIGCADNPSGGTKGRTLLAGIGAGHNNDNPGSKIADARRAESHAQEARM